MAPLKPQACSRFPLIVRRNTWLLPVGALFAMYVMFWAWSPSRSRGGATSQWTTRETGILRTPAYRVYCYGASGSTSLSFWHDVPLYRAGSVSGDSGPASKAGLRTASAAASGPHVQLLTATSGLAGGAMSEPDVVHFVCEIPRGTKPKFEIQKGEPGEPIAQDTDDGGNLREYRWQSLGNYGALPRTYEHPALVDPVTQRRGDGDPVDAIDVCPASCKTGEIYAVGILGGLAMIDKGDTDWKIIVSRLGCMDGELQKQVPDLRVMLPTMALRFDAQAQVTATKQEPLLKRYAVPSRKEHAAAVTDLVEPDGSGDGGTTTSSGGTVVSSADQRMFPYDQVDGPGSHIQPPPHSQLKDGSYTVADWLHRLLLFLKLWLRDYKRQVIATEVSSPGGVEAGPRVTKTTVTGAPNGFDLDGLYVDSQSAVEVVRLHHAQYCVLMIQASLRRSNASSSSNDRWMDGLAVAAPAASSRDGTAADASLQNALADCSRTVPPALAKNVYAAAGVLDAVSGA